MLSSQAAQSPRLIFLRGLIWSIIGLIYAPLFACLDLVFQGLGLEHGSFIPAAAIAGLVGAIFYGARQVAIIGVVIGLLVATLAFFSIPGHLGIWQVALPAAAVGAGLGWLVRFPDRCSLQVPGKALAGLMTGAVCGLVLAFAQPLHPERFHVTGVVAFLVSVNGILYVATLAWWVRRARIGRGRSCNLVESLVIGVLAAAAAASLWVVAGPLIGAVDGRYGPLLDAMLAQVPVAMLAGATAGALTGALLQAFRFRWVHDG